MYAPDCRLAILVEAFGHKPPDNAGFSNACVAQEDYFYFSLIGCHFYHAEVRLVIRVQQLSWDR